MAFFDKQGKNYFAKQLEIHGMEQYMGLEKLTHLILSLSLEDSLTYSLNYKHYIIETLICDYFCY